MAIGAENVPEGAPPGGYLRHRKVLADAITIS